jgi:hypothetical protein
MHRILLAVAKQAKKDGEFAYIHVHTSVPMYSFSLDVTIYQSIEN